MGSTPPATPNAGNAAAPRRVVASRVDAAKVMTDSRTARARPDARESVSPSETRASETRASIGSKEKKQKAVSAEKTERALQRAFLARHPTARRVVEFVADAAAAADASLSPPTTPPSEDAVVAAAAAAAAAARPGALRRRVVSGAEDAGSARRWPPLGALAPVETRRGGRRGAAAATKALLVPDAEHHKTTRDAPAADAVRRRLRRAPPCAASAGAFCGAAAAADAARLAAADRVRRTLPFEIHARVQSAARAKLRFALAAKKKPGDVATADQSRSRAENERFLDTSGSRVSSSRVSAATAALVAAANANDLNPKHGGDADDDTHGVVRVSSLSFSHFSRSRRAANALRVALAATIGRGGSEDRNDSTEFLKLDGTTSDGTTSDDVDDVAVVSGLANALVASLFHAPPRRVERLRHESETKNEKTRLSSREWDDAADAAAAFASLVASRRDATAADAFASAFFDPAKHWAPRMAAFPESPHTQRAAEDAAPSFFRRLLDAIAKKEDSDAMGVALARSTRDMLLAVTSEESVGCVGAASALRAGAALADVLGSFSHQKTLADGASDARRTETERLFTCLLRLCLNAGERRTARRVENAARRCGFSFL